MRPSNLRPPILSAEGMELARAAESEFRRRYASREPVKAAATTKKAQPLLPSAGKAANFAATVKARDSRTGDLTTVFLCLAAGNRLELQADIRRQLHAHHLVLHMVIAYGDEV